MNPLAPDRRQARLATILRIVLRYIGSVALLSAVAVFMPYAWMDTIHRALGLGSLPEEPIVGYLTRTLSAFYALLGGLLWVTSFDLRRHRSVLTYLGAAFVVFGLIALWVDFREGMPLMWRVAEGPMVVFWGTIILVFSRRLPPAAP